VFMRYKLFPRWVNLRERLGFLPKALIAYSLLTEE
jgi:hypothetical protein